MWLYLWLSICLLYQALGSVLSTVKNKEGLGEVGRKGRKEGKKGERKKDDTERREWKEKDREQMKSRIH